MSGKISLFVLVAVCLVACSLAASTSNKNYPRYSKTKALRSNKVSTEAKKDDTKAIIQIAKALARSHSTSEVLTLNLTNLLILIVLKAIIFGIGLFYFGGVTFKGGHGGWGEKRSLDTADEKSSKPLMTQGEMTLMLTYLLGAANDNYECMNRVACEDPSKAKPYLQASKMVVKGAKLAKKYVSYNPKYEEIVHGLQDAIEFAGKGGDCRQRYTCSEVTSL